MNKIIAAFFLFFLLQNCFAQEQNKSVSTTNTAVDAGAVQAVPAPGKATDQQEPDVKENLPAPKAEPAQDMPSSSGVLPPGTISSPAEPEHEVEFFIQTNKRIYRQGENIYMRFWIKNNGDIDVRTIFKDAFVEFFTDKRGYGLQAARDFVVDKSGFPRYVVLCIPTNKKLATGTSLRQVIIKPGFYLTGQFNVMVVYGTGWISNVVPVEVWNQFDMDHAGAPDDGVSGEEFIKQKPKDSPFIVEPF